MSADSQSPGAARTPVLTILICTYNRADELGEVVDSLERQEGVDPGECEVLVVDNNSTDQTRQVISCRQEAGLPNLRYLFEPRQGKSFALNLGIAEARGTFYAVIDDDLILPPTYLRDLISAICDNPESSAFGGKVLPLYQVPPPGWLTPDIWAPVGIADFGEQQIIVGRHRQICFMAGTLRRADVKELGGYCTHLGVRGRSVIGGTEDSELMQRLWRSGREGVYLPHLVLYHKVPEERVRRSHFRRWHLGHGRSKAMERDPELERGRGHFLGVPLHLYRAAGRDLAGWVSSLVRGDRTAAIKFEDRLFFFAGFLLQRLRREEKMESRPVHPSSSQHAGA
jgi:glucosyl-dolichyl phosphate glucuronosyltransferase